MKPGCGSRSRGPSWHQGPPGEFKGRTTVPRHPSSWCPCSWRHPRPPLHSRPGRGPGMSSTSQAWRSGSLCHPHPTEAGHVSPWCVPRGPWGPSEQMAVQRGWMGGGGETLLLEGGAQVSQLCYSVAG